MSKKTKNDEEPKKLKNKVYLKELRKLQEKVCHLQEWVKFKGLRVIIVFEGRDAAGKGGTIRALTERVSPRVFRLVALPAPSTARSRNCTYSATFSISRPSVRS
jgi:polyphosphate kinase